MKTLTAIAENESEGYLITKAQQGDHAAFAALMLPHRPKIFGQVWQILQNREEAEDVVQDILLSVWKNLGRFERRAKFSTWLFTATRNTCLNRKLKLSKASRWTMDIQDEDSDLLNSVADQSKSGDPFFNINIHELRKVLPRALANLSSDHKYIIEAYYLIDLSIEEIANKKGLSAGTVRSQKFYALRALSGELMRLGFFEDIEWRH